MANDIPCGYGPAGNLPPPLPKGISGGTVVMPPDDPPIVPNLKPTLFPPEPEPPVPTGGIVIIPNNPTVGNVVPTTNSLTPNWKTPISSYSTVIIKEPLIGTIVNSVSINIFTTNHQVTVPGLQPDHLYTV